MTYALTGLEGKVAVVTGAGRMRSIGRPIAVELARAGCDVVVTGTGRDPSTYPDEEQAAGWRDIESVADEIRALGRRALPLVTSVADPDAVDALADRVVAELGRVDVLVNNTDFLSLATLMTGASVFVLELQSAGTPRFRGFAIADGLDRNGQVDGLIEATLSVKLATQQVALGGATPVFMFAGYSVRSLTSS